ncbi:MAG: carbohydrate ABC transporter permease [Bauldia sp.]|nr:carbohydrate ABC transporter permease [Bauldia sp.]
MRPLAKAVTYALLAVWSLVCLLPVYWVAITSIKGIEDIDRPPGYVPFVDFQPSLEAWRFILFEHNENLVSRLVNSAVIGSVATLLTVVTSGMAIYGLTRFHSTMRWSALIGALLLFGVGPVLASASGSVSLAALLAWTLAGLALAYGLRRRGPVISASAATTMMLATRVLPPVVLVLPLYVLAQATAMRDTLIFMIFVYAGINIPVAVWLLMPVLGSDATDQEESAQLDGASHLTIFFTILLPIVRSSVIAIGLIIFILCWNEYLFAAYLTADHALTLPPWAVGQLSMKEAQVGGGAEELAHLSAATIVMMFPALVFAVFALRQLSRTISGRQP